jgi:hypothetical protein
MADRGGVLLHFFFRKQSSLHTLKRKVVEVTFRNSFLNPRKAERFAISELSRLILLQEVICPYPENHAEPMNIVPTQVSSLTPDRAGLSAGHGLRSSQGPMEKF